MPRDPRIPGGTKRPANGAGYGGPAKGAGNRSAGPGRPAGVRNGEGKAARSADLCAPHVADAVEVWRVVMVDSKQPAQARIAAAEKIIARAEGATPQRIAVVDERDLDSLTDAELAALARGGAEVADEEGLPH